MKHNQSTEEILANSFSEQADQKVPTTHDHKNKHNANLPDEDPNLYDQSANSTVAGSSEGASSEPGDFCAQITELTNDLQRTRADFENYRKAVEAQKSQAMANAKYATIVKFLGLIDDFDRAITAYPEQLQPLAKSFQKTLRGLGLEKVNSDPGVEFNPDFHEAVSVEEEGGETEIIAETLRPGYLYEKAVIRPAMVKVRR